MFLDTWVFKKYSGYQINCPFRISLMIEPAFIMHVHGYCRASGFLKMHQVVSAISQPLEPVAKCRYLEGRLHPSIYPSLHLADMGVNDSAGQDDAGDERPAAVCGLLLHKQASCLFAHQETGTSALFSVE